MGYDSDANMDVDTDTSTSEPASEVESGKGGITIEKMWGYISDNNMGVDQDIRTGVQAYGTIRGYDEGYLMGSVYLLKRGDVIDSQDLTSISFSIFGSPPLGVEQGELKWGRPEYTFRFEPENGLPYAEVDIVPPLVNEYDIGYGALEGQVTDAEGNPVKNELISIEDRPETGAATDENGQYRFQAGAGTYTFVGLGKSKKKEETIDKFSEETLNWQFAGLTVFTELPDGTLIEGADVELDGRTGVTDASGDVLFPQLPVNTDFEAKAMGISSDTYTLGEGEITWENIFKYKEMARAGIKGKIISEGGRDLRNIEVMVEETGGSMLSNADGKYWIVCPAGKITVFFRGENRYFSEKETLTIPEDTVREKDVQLAEKGAYLQAV